MKYKSKSNNYGSNEETDFSTNIHDNNKELQDVKSSDNKKHAATFDEAIEASQFGKFNYLLLILTLPSAWSTQIDSTGMSFVIPEAQCDLGLGLVQMGILNASCFAGMISSGFIWGYLADSLGRKHILMYGFLLHAFSNFLSAFSTSSWMLVILKIFNGFIISGPSAVLMCYLSEFSSSKFRSPIVLINGIYIASTTLTLAFLAYIVMPIKDIILFSYVIHSWQLYLFITGIPSLLASIGFSLMPESPKFLMTIGKNEQALKIFKKIYAINSGNSSQLYPIDNLIDEVGVGEKEDKKDDRNTNRALSEGWQQIKLLFSKHYIWKLLLIITMNFFTLLGANTLRLWLPKLFTIIDEFNQENKFNADGSLCEMLEYSVTKVAQNATSNSNITKTICTKIKLNDQVYINSVIVGVAAMIMYGFAAIIVNRISKRILLGIFYFIAGCSGIALIWSNSLIITLILSCISVSFTSVTVILLISVIVDLFPTSLRTKTVALSMTIGRIGTIIGNIVFPLLLMKGCLTPFLMTGGVALVCMFLVLLLPAKKQESFT